MVAVTCALLTPAAHAQLPVETRVSRELCSGLFVVPPVWSPPDHEARQLRAVFDTGGTHAFIDPDCLERISGRRNAIRGLPCEDA